MHIPSAQSYLDVRAVARFEGVARQAIHELKYNGHFDIATVLGPLMATAAESPARALVPVPLHPSRQRLRGYNQSYLLARHAGAALTLPVLAGRLKRIRPTRDQVSLTAAERRVNVEGAFQWNGPRPGGAVILVDDVLTTGATMAACGRALAEAGIQPAQGLVFAAAGHASIPPPQPEAAPR